MPVIKGGWDAVPDAGNFQVLPHGLYRARCTKSEEVQSNKGEQFRFTMTVLTPPYQGVDILDSVTFSEKGISRVKLVYGRMGFGTKGTQNVDLKASDLVGKEAIIEVYPEEGDPEKIDPKTGRPYLRNVIPFAGYFKVDSGLAVGPFPEDAHAAAKPAAPAASNGSGAAVDNKTQHQQQQSAKPSRAVAPAAAAAVAVEDEELPF